MEFPAGPTSEQLYPGLNRLRRLRGLDVPQGLVQQHIPGRSIRLQQHLEAAAGTRGQSSARPLPEQIPLQQSPKPCRGSRRTLTFLSSSLFLRRDSGSRRMRPRRASSMRIPPRSPEEMQSFQKEV